MVKELKNELEFDELTSKGVSLVDFNATWCGPCRMLKPIFHEASDEVENANFIGVDVDEFPALAGKFNVRAVPTLVLIKDGKVVNIKTGLMQKEALVALVKEAL